MSGMNEFLQWLENEHAAIMGVEHGAIEALNSGDTEKYRDLMGKKAEMLANIAEKGEPHTAGLSPDMADKVMGVLHNFANSAAMSLRLHSVFFMSALLYRDDHKPGEPDNLEVYIRSLRENFTGGGNG